MIDSIAEVQVSAIIYSIAKTVKENFILGGEKLWLVKKI